MQRPSMLCLLVFTSSLSACIESDDDASLDGSDTSEVTMQVANAAQLMHALARVNPGDTIMIAAHANLGTIEIDGARYPKLAASGSRFITIGSAASDPAVFEGLVVRNVKNFRMTNVELSSVTGVKEPFVFEDSQHVELSSVVVRGRRANGLGTGNGPFFRRDTDVTILNNDFLDLHTSLYVGGSTHVRIAGNQLLRGSYDTIHIGASMSDLSVEDNTIRAFPDSSVRHVDYIQFTNQSGGPASHDIVVRNNDFRITNSVEVHGIYLGNYDAQAVKNGGPKSDWYKNVLIENNYVESRQMAAIAVSYAVGVTVRGNTLKRAPGPVSNATITKPTILVEVDDTDVEITGNTTVTAPRAGHLVTGWLNEPIPRAWTVGHNTVAN